MRPVTAMLLVLALAACGREPAAPAARRNAALEAQLPAPGDPLPPLDGRTLDGAPVSRATIAGRTALLNHWFRDCPTCIEELPLLQRIHEDLGARDDVVVLALNRGDSREAVAAYWREQGFTFDAVLEDHPGRNAQAMGVLAYPTNIVVGPDGTVLFAGVLEPDDIATIRALLGL